jgi:hypothetical protein
MGKYIDKDALVAEIEKELNATKKYSTEYVNGKKYALKKILSFLDTLEEKEVDLDFETELYKRFGQVKDFILCMRIAKHFYELGLKAQKGE